MSLPTKDKFEEGIFWDYYKDLEKQFENFLDYVPYLKGNGMTYSFRLANLILATGAHIDSAFKEMAEYPGFSSRYPNNVLKRIKTGKPTIRDYSIFVTEYSLSQKKVIFKRLPDREDVKPFEKYKITNVLKTPTWWKAYNGIKHEFGKNFRKASLKNARDALAGAFLLNVIHEPAVLRLYRYGVLKVDYMGKGGGHPAIESGINEPQLLNILRRKQKYDFVVETSIFKYSFDQ